MARPKAVSISRPFDARHVGGVSVPGATIPVVGMQTSSISSLEPDEIPTHINMSSNARPRRSNTIAHSFSRPSLSLKTSISRLRGRSSSNSPDTHRRTDRDSTPDPPPRPTRPESEKTLPVPPTVEKLIKTRPKRADSGTAIDFDDVPVDERPMGFKEIVAIKSFEERMMLYKKTRDYWASANHGLDQWIGNAITRRPLVAQA